MWDTHLVHEIPEIYWNKLDCYYWTENNYTSEKFINLPLLPVFVLLSHKDNIVYNKA